MGLFGSSSSKIKVVPTGTASQKEVDPILGSLIKQGLQSGATKISGPLYPEIPELFKSAYSMLASSLGQYNNEKINALMQDVNAVPAWSWNEGTTQSIWRRTFAEPAMETWKRTVAPLVKEQYAAVPGALYSSGRAKGVSQAASDYYSQYVQPTLWQAHQADIERAYQSAEAAAARRPAAVEQLSALPLKEFTAYASAADVLRTYKGQEIEAQRNEALRLAAENNPYLAIALQYLGTPQTSVAVKQGSSSPLAGMLGGALLGGLGGISKVFGGSGGFLQSAALGALLGM